MNKTPLDVYEEMPRYMKKYISNYGWHFNKAAYKYATKLMKRKQSGITESVKPYTKEEVDELIKQYNIPIVNKIMYDYVYVATMCRADYYGSCIDNDHKLVLFIRDTVDDVDASDETTFRRWVATMIGNGCPIDWEEIC